MRVQYTTFWSWKGQELPVSRWPIKPMAILNADKSNGVWICHALTANAEVRAGGRACRWAYCIDPKIFYRLRKFSDPVMVHGAVKYWSFNQATLFYNFPVITIRDMWKRIYATKVSWYRLHLLLMGGSMGGYQAMEWPWWKRVIKNFSWSQLVNWKCMGNCRHTAQRLAIEAMQLERTSAMPAKRD